MAPSVVTRTCVGCRQRAAKRELLRLVAGADACDPSVRIVVPDPTATAVGRGAYIHPTTDCLALAERRRAFPRALRVPQGMSADAVRVYVEQLKPTDLTDRPRWSTSS